MHVKSWRQVQELGPKWRDSPYRADAENFAREFMLRLREVVERIVGRLVDAGYVFRWPEQTLVAPPHDIVAQLDELESAAGLLPLTLRAAYEHFGTCCLEGDLAAWPQSANTHLRSAAESEVWFTDPLVISPVEHHIEDAFDLGGGATPFRYPVCADSSGKAGFSAGRYCVLLPSDHIDPPIEGGTPGLTFLAYLQTSLAFGGFAGFATIENRPQAFLNALMEGCPTLIFE